MHLNMKRTSTQASLDSISIPQLISSGPDSQESDSGLGAFERPPSRLLKRPRLLGSPFDLAKRIQSRQRVRGVVDDDDDGSLHDSDLSSSIGPQRSGLPRGDIFSPSHRSSRGRSSFSHGWLMTPEDE